MFRLGMISATLGVALMVACSTKVTQDDCDDGYGRAGDGECYELASGFPCANDEVLNADGDCVEATGGSDLDADEGPPPDEGPDVDSDEGPPPDQGGDEGPPPDEGGDFDEGPPPDEGGDEGPPPDEGGDFDDGPPPDEGGDEGPPPDEGGDFDDGPPPDEGGDEGPPPDEGGPSSCSSDAECADACFEDGVTCVCDPTPSVGAPACDSSGECPDPFTCDDSATSADGVEGICTPGDPG